MAKVWRYTKALRASLSCRINRDQTRFTWDQETEAGPVFPGRVEKSVNIFGALVTNNNLIAERDCVEMAYPGTKRGRYGEVLQLKHNFQYCFGCHGKNSGSW